MFNLHDEGSQYPKPKRKKLSQWKWTTEIVCGQPQAAEKVLHHPL